MKGKGERKRYIQVNAELQRIARIDKKPFLKDHCKEIKGKKKQTEWERLEISSRKWRYQRNITCKDGHFKDTNSNNLTKAEDIKKR